MAEVRQGTWVNGVSMGSFEDGICRGNEADCCWIGRDERNVGEVEGGAASWNQMVGTYCTSGLPAQVLGGSQRRSSRSNSKHRGLHDVPSSEPGIDCSNRSMDSLE